MVIWLTCFNYSRHVSMVKLIFLRLAFLMPGLLLLGTVTSPYLSAEEYLNAQTPRLVVVIVVDQLRADLLDRRYQHGLARLSKQGRVYEKAMLGHAVSTTCPGHAVVLTGNHPYKVGIPSNSFFDEETGETRYCVYDDDPQSKEIGGSEQRSPSSMKVTTLGDWLKASSPESKVFSVSAKDRAAITLGGHHANGAFWFSRETGHFLSSGYYMQELPGYLRKFNGADPVVDGYMKDYPKRWMHGPGSAREDDFPGEDTEFSSTSGHPVLSGSTDEIVSQVFQSPYIDEATLGLALEVVHHEQLGQGKSMDVLAISLSATDTIGHLYGPNSAEAEDNLQRLDRLIGSLLSKLDASVGEQGYVVAFTADHGVADLPEWQARKGTLQCTENGGRIGVLPLLLKLYWKIYWDITFPFGDPRQLVSFSGAGFSINREFLRKHDKSYDVTRAAIESFLEENDFVANAWNVSEIETGDSDEAELMRRSYVPGRSGDLMLQFHPGCMFSDSGTTHGSLYHYDRHIPLIFYGWNVAAGRLDQSAMSVDIGPTLAKHIGIEIPDAVDGVTLSLGGPLKSH